MDATPRRFRWIHRTAVGSLFIVLALGCEERPTSLEGQGEIEIIISDVLPRDAGQRETVDVQIFGSGFQPGDEVAFELHGEEISGIEVKETLFANGRRLIATLSIGADVVSASYDVVVRGRHRRRGIGTESFDVLDGRGSELEAQLSFNYEGHRTGDFEVDNTFILEPDEMFGPTGNYALTYFNRTMQEQVISAQQPRADGRIDWIACWAPGGTVREPGSRLLECWMEIGLDLEASEWDVEDSYTSWIEGGRPADGSGRITFTSVTTHRLTGEFSIEMHQEFDWDGELETLLLTDGIFDLPVISAHWESAGAGEEDLPHAAYEAVLLPGSAHRATHITDNGFVTGAFHHGQPSFLRDALRWRVGADGGVTGPDSLGTLDSPFDATTYDALGVNLTGTVVGIAHARDDHPSTGFVYAGEMSRLRSNVEGTEYQSSGAAINNAGHVAGWLSLGTFSNSVLFTRGAVWLDPLNGDVEPILLEPLPGHDRTSAGWINDRGHVVGFSWDSAGVGSPPGGSGSGDRRTVRWQIHGDDTVSDPVPITRDAEKHFEAAAMTANGDVVGTFSGELDGGGLVRFGSDAVIRLSTVAGSHPYNRLHGVSVSPGGLIRVIGTTRGETSGIAGEFPVLWEIDTDDTIVGPLQVKPPPSRAELHLSGINAHGWMVGHSYEPGGEVPTLWRPAPPAAAAGLSPGITGGCARDRDLRSVPRCRRDRPGGPGR